MPLPSNSSQEILLGAGTTAGQTQTFDAFLYDSVIIACPGLAGSETGTVSVITASGNAITAPIAGGGATLVVGNQAARFLGRCRLSITTSATVASVPIYVIPGPAKP